MSESAEAGSPGRLSRRSFLAASGGIAAGVLAGGRLPRRPGRLRPRTASLPPAAALTVTTGGYPRAFAYRQSDFLANRLSYSQWCQEFAVLGGVVGKALREEVTTISPNVASYFNTLKASYPQMLVQEHLNGWARLPQFETTNWWPGFWLYRAGSPATAPIAATDTVLHVADASLFKVGIGLYRNRGDDVVICNWNAATGTADFSTSEQVVVTSVDATSGTITVTRGAYGTSPRSFPAGCYVAPHVSRGPYNPSDPMLWVYNFATQYSADPGGNTVVDAIIAGLAPGEGLAAKFATGGLLARFTGITLDILVFDPPVKTADVNNDGVADAGVIDNVDVFGAGGVAFMEALAAMLGPSRVLISDFGTGQRPPSGVVSGVEREGFPALHDTGFNGWSTALMGLRYWATFGGVPGISYPLLKFLGKTKPSFAQARLTFAASVLENCAVTFWDDPDGGTATSCKAFTVWDELVAGTEQTPNWLGAPVAAATRLATRAPDLLGGSGLAMSSAFVNRLSGSGVSFSVSGSGAYPVLTVASTDTTVPSLTFAVDQLPVSGPDWVLSMQVRTDPEVQYDSSIPRMLRLTLSFPGTTKTKTQQVPSGSVAYPVLVYFRGLPSVASATMTVTLEGYESCYLSQVQAFAAPDTGFRQFANGVVLANPSSSPATFDLASLAPNTSLKRLQATSGQDSVTNNGAAVGASVVVPALDALFLLGQAP